jgi:superfamily I DNA/RNA helicase
MRRKQDLKIEFKRKLHSFLISKFKEKYNKNLSNTTELEVKTLRKLKEIKEKKQIKPENFYFTFAVAGAGKTHEIVSKFDLGVDSVLVSFLNTTIDRVIEKTKELKPELYKIYFSINKKGDPYLNDKKVGAKTIHKVARRVLIAYDLLDTSKSIYSFEIALQKKIEDIQEKNIKNKEKIFALTLLEKFKDKLSRVSYQSISFFELPLYSLTFEEGWINFIINNIDILIDVLFESKSKVILEFMEPYLKNPNSILLNYLASKVANAIYYFYEEILEPLYFDNQKYITFTSLLGLCYKYNIPLFSKENLKKVFIILDQNKENISFIVDEAQDLNPLMVYLILISYQDTVNYYFYGDPYQAINSFQGSSIHFIVEFFRLIDPPGENITIKEESHRINDILSEKVNGILDIIRNKYGIDIFNKIKSKRPLKEEEIKELNEISGELSEAFLFKDKILKYVRILRIINSLSKKRKVVVLVRTNEEVFNLIDIFTFTFGVLPKTTQRDLIKVKEELEDKLNTLSKMSKENIRESFKFIEKKLKFLKRIRQLFYIKGFRDISLYVFFKFLEKYLNEKNKDFTIEINDNLIISTVNAYKGKEADIVFYFNEKNERTLDDYLYLYTAITRASLVFYMMDHSIYRRFIDVIDIGTELKCVADKYGIYHNYKEFIRKLIEEYQKNIENNNKQKKRKSNKVSEDLKTEFDL